MTHTHDYAMVRTLKKELRTAQTKHRAKQRSVVSLEGKLAIAMAGGELAWKVKRLEEEVATATADMHREARAVGEIQQQLLSDSWAPPAKQ